MNSVSSSSSFKGTKVIANFGRIWGQGYERLSPDLRRILSVKGPGATQYLQGLVTSDLNSAPTPPTPEAVGEAEPGVPKQYQSTPDLTEDDYGKVTFDEQLRATCFLDNKGRIISDSLLWKAHDEQYYIDCPTSTAEVLLKHLKQYKLRRTKVDIADWTDRMVSHVIFGTLNAEQPPPPPGLLARVDPRHPSLGMRVLENPNETPPNFDFEKMMQSSANATSSSSSEQRHNYTAMQGDYELVRRLAGVAEGAELSGQVALQANQDFLNAVSFSKGCYLGQELTARVQHTGAIRKRIVPLLLLDEDYQVPKQWRIAADMQRGRIAGKYSKKELRDLPPRQPRMTVSAALQLVVMASGSMIDPDRVEGSSAEHDYKVATELLDRLQHVAVHGAKITDARSNATVGKILSPPMKGTNVVTALCRLDSMALMGNEPWSFHNKVRIGDNDNSEERFFRYLPYLPFWWPKLDPDTGKAAVEAPDDYEEEEQADEENNTKIRKTATKTRQVKIYPSAPMTEDEQGTPSVGLIGGVGALGKMPSQEVLHTQKENLIQQQKREEEASRTGKVETEFTPKKDWFSNEKMKDTNE